MFTSNSGFSGSGYRMMSVKFYNDRLGLHMGWCQWTTYRKPPWSCDRWHNVTQNLVTLVPLLTN